MSGLLVCYLSLGAMEKGRFNIVSFYVHRIIRYTLLILKMIASSNFYFLLNYLFYRLTIPLGLTILFVSAIPQYMGYGPFFLFNTGQVCKDEGWKILLYVNNFYEESGGVSVNQSKVSQLVLYARLL